MAGGADAQWLHRLRGERSNVPRWGAALYGAEKKRIAGRWNDLLPALAAVDLVTVRLVL